ncbi:tetratricopeptide repeat protein [Novosphingobium mathurense]|uniref:Tetratricopeptide repeat-containing protein n=1 Tax=Novosphingobium mathurense TaxID=428990 RepID=A0A1U6GWP9_9SPHN|nr:tetratricopeptide repeat protein [Novosphingobium mathurense]SLJ87969.1 Tetratricopeptide repeat-containing protein [Novosphingobium mathurense]
MKYAIRLSLPLAAALLLAGCGASPEERLARAEQAYAAHNYSAARVDLASVIQEAPENAKALELLARTYIDLSDPVSAGSMLERLGRLGKLPADAAILQGNVDLMLGRYDKALAAVEGDGSAEAYRVRAIAHIGLGDTAKAGEAFAAGEKAPGSKGRFLADYASFQLENGNLAEARRLAELAAAEKPRPLNSYLTSADLLATDNRLDKALTIFEAGLKAYPESRAALLGKIRVLDALGKNEAVRPLVTKALADNPGDLDLAYFDARLDALDGKWQVVRDKLQPRESVLEQQPQANALYARALLELGQGEQARARLTSQLLREPDNRQVRLLLGKAELSLGDASDAVETLEPFAGLPDATNEELSLLAKAYKAAGRPDAAAVAQKAREAAGARIVSQLASADKAIRNRDWQTAIGDYEAILRQTDGNNVLVLNNLAFAYTRVGDQAKALTFAEKALRLAPDNASVMDTAGWLLHSTGKDRKRGLALLEQAARKAPDNATIASHLAQARKG